MAMNPVLQAVIGASASFMFITLVFSFIYCICHSKKKNNPDPESRRRTRAIRNDPNLGTSTSFISVPESQLFDPSLNQIDMSDLVKATRNFSPDLIVGDGSFGLVYKAHLPWGTVAVKKLAADAFQGYREFRAEMETLGKIKHDNIVKFYGYCATGTDRILIYEFIEHGSLDQWLYDMSLTNNESSLTVRTRLSWKTRVNIIKGVAKGLAFMHNLDTPIIHRDIKASNVLLDEQFEAHIADFGLARRMKDSLSDHVSTQVAGTMGYMPPEYLYGAPVATVMGDVYSFGVLMFEIVTSKRPNWPMKDEDGKEVRLVEWASKMVSRNLEVEMLDVGLSKDEINENEVLGFIKIATFCTTESNKLRPSMNEVVKLLNLIEDEATT